MEAVSPLVLSLLGKRGITDEAAVSAFLNPDYDLHVHDPFLMEGMERAVERLFLAMERGERIAVYADFDCDGIPGAALLSDFFKKISYQNFEVYLPHRDREGYGFHTDAIAQLAERGVKLIITVDVGTKAVEAVAFAKELGVDVIVTDHHEISLSADPSRRAPSAAGAEGALLQALPDAVAVLNPKLGEYPFRDLCGTGVAYKFVCAATAQGRRRALPQFSGIPDGWEKWLLDLVAIATVADMVPLVGENRVVAYWGLRVLRKSPRPGLRALCEALRLRQYELTEDDIGFSIAPRINAASRMGEPELALRLLTTSDASEARRVAEELEKLNASRKAKVASMTRKAKAHVEKRFADNETVVVLGDPEWKPALAGLVANSIVGERGGVACVWGRDAEGRLKGSCRSDGSISIVELFANAGDALVESGGHAASGGFTVSHERVHLLPEALAVAAQNAATAQSKAAEPSHDSYLSLAAITPSFFSEVSRLAPFGMGNPKPVFLVEAALVTEVKRFGKEKNHVELSLECRTSGVRCRAFAFFHAPEDFSHAPAQGMQVNVLGTLERDSFRGGYALRLVDVVEAV